MTIAIELRELIAIKRAALDSGDIITQLAIRLRYMALAESQRCEYPRYVAVRA